MKITFTQVDRYVFQSMTFGCGALQICFGRFWIGMKSFD